ncbi:binding-protein-dependent transport systems inner membrane component [Beutenbergia cavernae DSM 12333]|uniref:Binding-protein-dependent transport systems inner membrane component n=1 Tax=Beutenbergia cavernae (strain ATCC BAA-8 / DSM 12333 / CCUG 43141 / JCM 11478 / NBRC 16432 / NCIMB 13614 / HKI 0122) TaxID=471853 RepID=C5C2H2_BEUC1|nr:ABC transporter permease [Beutenbergia cavernae]ACQ79658.1 binding-protein-dependent transport systems inner membrane component [Beutenbergia cavernae DSM 12333]
MRYLLRKIALYLFIAWAALTMNFLIPRLMPGDPVSALLAKFEGQIDPDSITALREAFGISDDPLIVQYGQYLVDLWNRDLGLSLSQFPVPVTQIVASAMPWTIGLIGVTTIISFVIGTGLGIVFAWRRGSWSDHLLPALTFLNAVPYFWMALILVMVFGVNLGWFEYSNAYDASLDPGWTPEFIGSVISHALLPAITIVLASFAGWVMSMRNMTVTILGEDYVTMAEAKGLPQRMVMFGYAARNAILPNVTSFALSLGAVVGGSMLTEVIFNYPGIGYSLFNAVKGSDFPLMQGLFLMISLAVIVANLIADVLYVFLDPRTRQES